MDKWIDRWRSIAKYTIIHALLSIVFLFNSYVFFSADTIFVTALHEASNGIIGVNRKGQVGRFFFLDQSINLKRYRMIINL